MPTRVNLPDGTVGEFPDGMSEADIERVLQKQFGGPSTNRPAGLPAGVDLPQVAPHPAATMTEPTGASVIPAALTAGEYGKGLLKGPLNTTSSLGALIHRIPGGVGEALIPQSGLTAEQAYASPSNTAQKLGIGTEQAGEFLIPGAGEEDAVAHVAPLLERFLPEGAARVAAKAGVAGVGSGLVNKAQGGGFGTGALMGAGGSLAGQGLAAAAPHAVELAQGIRNAGGRTGRAILDETSGILPRSIRTSAKEATNQIGSELGDVLRRASERPVNPVRGLLPSPVYHIPLGEAPDTTGSVGGLFDAERFPAPNVGEARVIRNAKGQILPFADRNVEFPESRGPARVSPVRGESGKFISSEGMSPEGPVERPLLPIARDPNTGRMLTRQPTRKAWMAGTGEPLEPSPISGPGVILGDEKAARAAGLPFEPSAPEIPYRGISLTPFRDMAQQGINEANLKGDVKLAKGIGRINQNTLLNRGLAGERPETVSPYEFWKTKQGVGDAVSATKWRPGYNDPFTRAQKRIYGAMADTLHNEVPESIPLDRRYSNLIPAVNAPVRAPWEHAYGPGIGALAGGAEGYRREGVPGALQGALIGGAAGTVYPALLNAGARLAYNPATQRLLLPAATGAVLQTTRKDTQ